METLFNQNLKLSIIVFYCNLSKSKHPNGKLLWKVIDESRRWPHALKLINFNFPHGKIAD